MPNFYDLSIPLMTICIINAVLLPVLLFWLRQLQERTITHILLMLYAVIGACFGVLLLWAAIAPRLQAQIALPYIQDSIDTACPEKGPTSTADGFSIDSAGFQWISTDQQVSCYYDNERWICDCD